MNRDEIEVEDDKGKVRKKPDPNSVAAWANEHGVNVIAAEGLHDKLRRLFNKPYIVEKPAADPVGEIIKALERAACGAVVRQVRIRPGLPVRQQLADAPDP